MKHFVKSVALPATAMKTVGRIYKQLTHLVNIRKYVFVHLLRLQQCEQAEKKTTLYFMFVIQRRVPVSPRGLWCLTVGIRLQGNLIFCTKLIRYTPWNHGFRA